MVQVDPFNRVVPGFPSKDKTKLVMGDSMGEEGE